MNEKFLKRALDDYDRRRAFSLEHTNVDPKRVCAGHIPQYEFVISKALRILALCSRRAAKTTGNCIRLANYALKNSNRTYLYFGATGKAVRLLIWGPIWQAQRKRWGVGGDDNEALMVTRFANGSQVIFTGTDDYRHVETMLGGRIGGAIIDEAQSQPNSVLEPLVNRILPPALSDEQGWLILSGTIPEVEAGMFYELWRNENNWEKRNWNRFANPYIESEKALVQELINSSRSIDDPIIRRDWFGEFVFSNELTAFGYDRNKSGYHGNYPKLDMFAVGIDPGTRDRTAIIVWGWSFKEQNVYQVYEWVTPRNSNTHLSDIARELKVINQRFSPIPFWYMDMGGSKMAIDTFSLDYGLPVVHAAKKADRPAQVKRLADLLNSGRAKILIGSQLEMDLQRAAWDKDARARGQYEWSSAWHPDVADAGRYALQGYFDAYQVPQPKPDDASKEDKLWKESLKPPVEYGSNVNKDLNGFVNQGRKNHGNYG